MCTITFINQNSENNIEEAGRKHLASRKEDLEYYQIFGNCEEDRDFIDTLKEQDFDLEQLEKWVQQYRDLGPYNEYGISFGYVELGTFDDQEEDYFRYQFSWGGPSEELRLYKDGTIVFAYMDWFCGVGFDVTGEYWAEWVREDFEGMGMLDFDDKREESGYYDILAEKEAFDEEE